MKDGFCRVCAVTPDTVVADVWHNTDQIISWMKKAADDNCKVIVFPELCITGYTCGDLFGQQLLLESALEGLDRIRHESSRIKAVVFAGLPLEHEGRLYNVAASICNGKILGIVPKRHVPNYNEFYEARYFTGGSEECEEISVLGEKTTFGTDQIFVNESMPYMSIACELCEDLWVPSPPSSGHAVAGANIIVNLSASDEVVGKSDYRRNLVSGQSARCYAVYVYSSAGCGESSQDVVYSGHRIICENGIMMAESDRFTSGMTVADVDLSACMARRRSMNTFGRETGGRYKKVMFDAGCDELDLRRVIDRHPFVPENDVTREERCRDILSIQSRGLGKRLAHTHSNTAVIGISGGLDSTLALLVTVKAFDEAGLDRSGVIGITMPGFGTTDRTYDNACQLVRLLGATLIEIPIAKSVRRHFADIGQDESVHDVTYENSQARERTQILMDIANQRGGLVVGTGDLSELALGWATYNGDHMSMYGVNAGIPKTLVRHLVRYYAMYQCEESPDLKDVLLDVLDTPVSPELLPAENGVISQKTEDLVGPYELHDFFLYYLMRYGYRPSKIYRIACKAFTDIFDTDTIKKWLNVFYRRFFAQQFKRSCLPDGPKVGTVALSPRGDWRMPSDASVDQWLAEIDELG